MIRNFQLVFLIMTVNLSYCEISRCDNLVIQKLCLDQEICDNCLQVDECCSWCYDQVKTIFPLIFFEKIHWYSLFHKNFADVKHFTSTLYFNNLPLYD